jgi:hypothetical protein
VTDTNTQDEGRLVIAMRDSKDPDGPKLFVAMEAWERFLAEIKAGELDLPDHMRELLDERFR